jgi:hypothetical protein
MVADERHSVDRFQSCARILSTRSLVVLMPRPGRRSTLRVARHTPTHPSRPFMKTIMVRYKTSSTTHADANAALIRAVFDELRARAPGGLRYTSYRLADGVTFVHIATHDSDNPLTSLPAFKAFQAELKDRCVELPVVTELSVVDSYGH